VSYPSRRVSAALLLCSGAPRLTQREPALIPHFIANFGSRRIGTREDRQLKGRAYPNPYARSWVNHDATSTVSREGL